MAGKAVYQKLAAKFGTVAAKTYLYGDSGSSAFQSGDLETVGKIDKIQKYFGHPGISSQKEQRTLKSEFKNSANQKKSSVYDRTFKPLTFTFQGKKYKGFIDDAGQKWVGQPNGGLRAIGG